MDYTKYNFRADCDLTDNGDHPCYVMDDGEHEGIAIAKVDGFIGNGDGIESEAITNLFAKSPKLFEALQNLCDDAERMAIWDKTPNDSYYKAIKLLKELKYS